MCDADANLPSPANATLSFALHFQSETGGWFTSRYFGATDGYWPFFGTFTITAVP